MLDTALKVKVGDDVTLMIGHREPESIVRVDHITNSGLIDAGGERWRADGERRGDSGSWQRRRIVAATQEHRVAVVAKDIKKECERLAQLFQQDEVIKRMGLTPLANLVRVLEQLKQVEDAVLPKTTEEA